MGTADVVGLLCLLTCGVTVQALAGEEGVWGEVLTLDCEGRLHFLSNSPAAVSFDLSDASATHEFWVQKLLERARERCEVSDTVLKTLLPTLEWALSFVADAAQGPRRLPCDEPDADARQHNAFLPLLPNAKEGSAGIVAPKSCSEATIASGEGCLMQYFVDPGLMPSTRLQAAIDSCPERKHAFFLSITAAGTGATTLLKPCDAETDCGGAVCSPLPGFENLGTQDATLRSYLSDLFLFDLGLDRPSCVAQGGDIDFIHELKDFLLASFFAADGTARANSSRATFCGADVIGRFPHYFPDCSSSFAPLHCNGLSEWDGVLPSGTHALSSSRKSGEVFARSFFRLPFDSGSGNSSTGHPVFAMRGALGAAFLQLSDGLGVSMVLPNINDVLQWGSRLLKEIQDCRADGSVLTSTQFFSRFVPFRPEFLFARYSALTSAFDWGKPMRDPLNRGRLNPAPGGLRMPDSCSLGSWIAGGSSGQTSRCTVLYTGLMDLFAGSDLNLTMAVSDGGSGVALPDVELRCVGLHCSLLSNVTFCSASQDCAGGTTCEDLVFGKAYSGLRLSSKDLVGDMLWNTAHRISSGCCSARCDVSEPWISPVCSSLDFLRNLHEWLGMLSGAESYFHSTANMPGALRVCSVSPTALDQRWSVSQIIRSGPVYWIRGLVSPEASARKFAGQEMAAALHESTHSNMVTSRLTTTHSMADAVGLGPWLLLMCIGAAALAGGLLVRSWHVNRWGRWRTADVSSVHKAHVQSGQACSGHVTLLEALVLNREDPAAAPCGKTPACDR